MQHPTQKPEGICNKLISKFSDKNQLILDPFAGSFTTAVACKELHRNCIAIEIDPKYYEIGKRRIQNTMQNLL